MQYIFRMRTLLLSCLLSGLLLMGSGAPAGNFAQPEAPRCSQEPAPGVPLLGIEILKSLPHDPLAFTQGLAWQDGLLYESTGRYGESELRVVRPGDGKPQQRRALPADVFGEGLTLDGPRIIQLTWKSGRILLWDAQTLGRAGEVSTGREAWGLARSGNTLYCSDGSERILLLDSKTFSIQGSIEVREPGENSPGRRVDRLNELEWVQGWLVANVWFEDALAVIAPDSGLVRAWIDLSRLRPRLGPGAGVANGVAWDGAHLLVTGKNWDQLFVLEVPGAPWK